MSKSKILLVILLVSALLLTAAATVQATGAAQSARPALPGEMEAYAGRLTTEKGLAVPDGAYDFNFALYDAPEGGSLLWSEAQSGVPLSSGAFTVQLGQVHPLPAAAAGWLSVEVRGPGEAAFTPLLPRQALERAAAPAPADVAAPAAETCAHDHFGETWTGSASKGFNVNNQAVGGTGIYGYGEQMGIFAESTSGVGLEAYTASGGAVHAISSGSGTGLYAASAYGKAIHAAGTVYSTAYSEFLLSPFSMLVRYPSTFLTLMPLDDGSILIRNDSGIGIDKYVTLPVTGFGTLLGSDISFYNLQVCYKVTNASNKIVATALIKNAGDGGISFYVNDITDRISTTLQCYTVPISSSMVFDNTTWVQFNLNFANTGSASDIRIYQVTLAVSETE